MFMTPITCGIRNCYGTFPFRVILTPTGMISQNKFSSKSHINTHGTTYILQHCTHTMMDDYLNVAHRLVYSGPVRSYFNDTI